MASSLLCQTKYDVFVSFRGQDIRRSFLSHLKTGLRQKYIDAFIDDERLESGEEISSALVAAIEASMISLVIFSENYATSSWCLEELVKIMQYNKVNNHKVIPVFYNIDPTYVRHQKGSYADAFAKHEHINKYNIKRLQSWRSALKKAANLSGHHYPSNFKDESELINKIVEDVLNKLDGEVTPDESPCLVGFDENFERVESLLKIDQSQDVRVIGIWGMGGIGKTTLARVIYNKLSSQFKSRCFMENVREESQKINGLSYLLHKLYCQLLEDDDLNTSDAQAKKSIMRRLSRKRVLVVLDDVDNFKQLEYLLEEQSHLGPGSRVIITCRDRNVLKGVQAIHEIGELNLDKSLELFSLFAFDERQPKMGFEELAKTAVSYAKGIPLALKVLGLHLHSRNKEVWKDALKKLRKHPRMEIQHLLRVSYDGLDPQEKDIFLDIAFFFRGHPKADVVRILDACDFYATSGIEILLDKALITIGDDNKIKMHDLLQGMGEQIVREESEKHPARRSRLNDIDDLYDLLQKNDGTDEIEGIVFDVSQIKKVFLSKDTFKKMPRLRILKMYSGPWCKRSNVSVPCSGIESFPDKLRYFHWDEYPLESPPPSFNTEKVVEFRMERSKVKKFWEEVKELENLMILNLTGSKQLMELPDLTRARNLERLLLSDCVSLRRVHPSVFSLPKPICLVLDRCLGLNNVAVTKLCSFTSLKQLSLSGCEQVNKMVLQMVFDTTCCLESLNLESCNNLRELPDNISGLSFLTYMNLGKSNVEFFPATFKHLPKLHHMTLNFCNNLQSIPELPPSLKYLHAQYCPKLKTVLVPSKNSMQQDFNGRMGKLDLWFKESLNMDEQQVMQLTSFSLMQAIHRNSSDPEHEASYPTSSIPWWFTYRATANNPFIIQLAPPSNSDDHLLGFVLCGILPRLADPCRICFYLFSEDGYSGYSNRVFGLSDSNRDLAFMWFAPFKKILGKSEGYNIYCKYICEASGQAVPGAACGVCPIYSSQINKIVGKLLESNTCHEDHIDDEKPKEIEIQPHFHINRDNQINPPPLAKEIDKEDQRKGLQLFL